MKPKIRNRILPNILSEAADDDNDNNIDYYLYNVNKSGFVLTQNLFIWLYMCV
jgi:hypothetical protein